MLVVINEFQVEPSKIKLIPKNVEAQLLPPAERRPPRTTFDCSLSPCKARRRIMRQGTTRFGYSTRFTPPPASAIL